MSLRFFTGDTNGLIKSIKFNINDIDENGNGINVTTMTDDEVDSTKRIEKLTINSNLISSCRSNSSIHLYEMKSNENKLNLIKGYNEDRWNEGDYFVGLSNSNDGLISCTNSGKLLSYNVNDDKKLYYQLPNHLRDFKLSPQLNTFAYGGLEVELSVNDLNRTLELSSKDSKNVKSINKNYDNLNKQQRKKLKNDLNDGELWRSKNLPNDNLNLRVPVHFTSLEYVDNNVLCTGSANGSIRLYDIRVNRRPVMINDELCKNNYIRHLKLSYDNNVLISDNNSNLFNVDLRNLKLINGFKGISGAINYASSCKFDKTICSASMDKFIRIQKPANSTSKAQTLSKIFVKSTPTVIEWDGNPLEYDEEQEQLKRRKTDNDNGSDSDDSQDELDDVLEGMETIEGEEMRQYRKAHGRRFKKKRV